MNDGRFISWEAAVTWLRQQPDQVKLVRDAYYDDPLIASVERYYTSEEWTAIANCLEGRTGKALDIGAGRGIASYALARRGFSVTALEPDPSSLVGSGAIQALARETGLPIKVRTEYSESLPFEASSFDLVFARACLHHTKDLESTCREAFRVLKPGGIFIAIREHVISRKGDLEEFLENHPLHSLYGGEYAYLLSEYTEAIQKAGFTIATIWGPLDSPINYYPHTEQSLQVELANRLGNFPGLRRALSIRPLFQACLRLLSLVDSRPGRLYSFRCRRPATKAFVRAGGS